MSALSKAAFVASLTVAVIASGTASATLYSHGVQQGSAGQQTAVAAAPVGTQTLDGGQFGTVFTASNTGLSDLVLIEEAPSFTINGDGTVVAAGGGQVPVPGPLSFLIAAAGLFLLRRKAA